MCEQSLDDLITELYWSVENCEKAEIAYSILRQIVEGVCEGSLVIPEEG